MTAAPETLTAFPRAAYASGGARALRHWERALIVLAVCLPVPVFAATGLSIPLPSTVERLAAALVPWADTASFEENEAAAVGADGSIVLAAHEVAATQVAAAVPVAEVAPTRAAPATKTEPKQTTKKGGGAGSGGTAAGGGAASSGDGGPGGGTSGGGGSGGGGDSSSTSGPVQTVAGGATQATEPVVGAVEETVDETVDTTTGVVEGVGKAVGGVLPLQGP